MGGGETGGSGDVNGGLSQGGRRGDCVGTASPAWCYTRVGAGEWRCWLRRWLLWMCD